MGNAHGLETLLDAAATLQAQKSKVCFLLIGEGAEKERIKGLAQSRELRNVVFLDQQPREDIPAFIAASDACLVLLKKTDVFKTVIPTKMLEFMSCARPVILGVEGQARQIVEDAGAGVVIEPENSAPRWGSEAGNIFWKISHEPGRRKSTFEFSIGSPRRQSASASRMNRVNRHRRRHRHSRFECAGRDYLTAAHRNK